MASIDKGLARARSAKLRARETTLSEVHVAPSSSSAFIAVETLPRVQLDASTLRMNRVLLEEDSPATAVYKMLRTRVLQRMRRNGWSTLAVTGTCPGEGKTLTAINLSVSMARDLSTTVILVDLDLRKPAIARYLGISPRYGLTDCLQGAVDLRKAVFSPGVERLGLLLNERPFTDSSEMLTSPQMAELVAQLKQGENRIVVFDMPPLLVADDMLAFSPLVDALLLVVSQGTTKQTDLLATKELLHDMNVVGVALNRSSESVSNSYYYGYSRY